jgi:hypothetical protein
MVFAAGELFPGVFDRILGLWLAIAAHDFWADDLGAIAA